MEPTPTFETHEIELCPTCVLFIANGDTPEPLPHDDGTPWHWSDGPATYPDGWSPDNIESNWPSSEGWQLHVGDGESSFSWSGCDCCGSRLGGDLYPGTAMRPTSAPA